jgi:hypothetical protein
MNYDVKSKVQLTDSGKADTSFGRALLLARLAGIEIFQ